MTEIKAQTQQHSVRRFDTANTPEPGIAILGTAPSTTIITNAGGGQTRLRDLAVNRWRADATLDDYGQWCYMRDVTTGKIWSAAHQPVCAQGSSYRVSFDSDRAVFERTDGEIDTRMEVAVSSSSAAELRRITLFNRSSQPREIELTTCAELVIGSASADRTHPAFHSLFVQTEWLEDAAAILAMRRPRSAAIKPVWCGQVLAVLDNSTARATCETDRAKFIGRGRSSRNPIAMDNGGDLSGRVGAVLDPVFAIRTRIPVPAGSSAQVIVTTFMAADRPDAAQLARRYNDPLSASGAFETACTEARESLRVFGITAAEAALYQELAGRLVFGDPAQSVPSSEASGTGSGQARLRALGISGEVPIVLASIQSSSGIAGARQLLRTREYWKQKGISCDLVILAAGAESLVDEVTHEVAGSSAAADTESGILVRQSSRIDAESLALLRSIARLQMDCDSLDLESLAGSTRIGEQIRSGADSGGEVSAESGSNALLSADAGIAETRDASDLRFFNGLGGFNHANEYEIRLSGDELPPAPWINVVANESAGFTASETGAGSTWVISSNSFRLSPWQNDPVGDRPGECIYIRDDETDAVWTPAAGPIREQTAYVVRHGAGYSTYDHVHDGIATSLRMGVPKRDSAKLQVLTLANTGSRARKLTIAGYVEWVLGTDRETTRGCIRASLDAATEVIYARNQFHSEFAEMVAFLAMSEPLSAHGVSRREFLGRNGTLSAPVWLAQRASHRDDASAVDPCAALETRIELAPGESRSVAIVLGAARGMDEAAAIVARYRSPVLANAAIDDSAAAWRTRLDAIVVHTPEPAFDLMVNQWALYQALSCRIWGRTALYQSSGAFGFRDQLQDVMALTVAEPLLAREQIIRAAARQFEEGDVQHWWHPHSGRGVRTRFSDDLIWLPFVTDQYLRVTHDDSVLDEPVPYLSMRVLEPDEDELFALPGTSDVVASVMDHCIHALNRACTAGEHGLPLIRSGDWNDGMNRVGIEGRGESVWLAWFLIRTLRSFADRAEAKGYAESAAQFRRKAGEYAEAVERSAWDGEWYRRAYYDDGAPLGSHVNEECQIDSIAQSWSVISGAGDPARSGIAMQSLNARLVREDARLIMLLTPPFDRSTHDPGYIQGYLPGVRENGAQYTHAALWAVLATAMRGDGDRAMELYQMINPITHSSTAEDVARYKVEPYVVAADVYTAEGHLGRGGWTWYTGSASWLYRVGLEAILGFEKRGDELAIDPCIPSSWKEFSIEYRHGESVYTILVRNPSGVQRGVQSVTVDGVRGGRTFSLVNDGRKHEVVVVLGAGEGESQAD